jgi:hypothetical protein
MIDYKGDLLNKPPSGELLYGVGKDEELETYKIKKLNETGYKE